MSIQTEVTSEITVSVPEAPDALIALTARLDTAEAQYHRSERRFRLLSGTLLGAHLWSLSRCHLPSLPSRRGTPPRCNN